MNVKYLFPVAALASFGLLAACSESSTSSSAENGYDGKIKTVNGVVASNMNFNAAKVKLASYARSVANEWTVDTTAAAPDTVSSFDVSALNGGNFAIEANVWVDSSESCTIASAGIDGSGFAWALQIENGKVALKWRAKKDDEWAVLKASKEFRLGEWNDVRLEHVDSLSVLIVNGEIAGAYKHSINMGDLLGKIDLDFVKSAAEGCDCKGRISSVRVEYIFDIFEIPGEKSSSSSAVIDTSATVDVSDWIAAWEFNDAKNVGRDFTGNGHDAKIGEGKVKVENNVAIFDGKSGFSVPLTPDFKINDFVIESRFNPASSSRFNNILVSEPPGSMGDGWILRLEYGKLVFAIRDYADGSGWSIFNIAEVPMKEWTVARVERLGDEISFFVNDTLIKAVEFKGDVSNLTYDWGLGYDAMNQGYHDRYFDGKIDYVRFGSTKGGSKTENSDWIAAWEFKDDSNVGRDFTGNGHDAKIGEGAVASVDGIAVFDGKSGFSVKLDDEIKINEFVVEARVKPTQFGTMQNIIVAEPPGRGVDGWQLRIDEGVLTVHLRDSDKDGDNWNIFPGKRMALGEWSAIRVERSADSLKMFQDGELTVAVAYSGDLTQMRYDWSIGFDGMQQAFHNRYFIGEMDYIRFGKFEGFSVGGKIATTEVKPLVAWEFNEPSFVGLDKMANNSTRYEFGSPVVVDSTVVLDGKSGLQVPLSTVFLRNTFAVEARVKPAQFSSMQNIIVAEPPGRYGDGWIIRLDNGVLTAHFRDEDTDGTTWNLYKGDKLALNEWTKIRVERSADSIKVFQNDNLVIKVAAKGDVSQLGYNIGIGYDAMKQANHDRFFVGEIDYIRYYGL